MELAVVGCGVFGLAAALELRTRGHRVVAFDQGIVPYPGASSYDASKTIQRLYGRRAHYVALAEQADRGWRAWQARVGGEPFYRDVGHVFVARGWEPGTRGHDSATALGLAPLSPAEARRRFPQFAISDEDTVFFDAWGGYLESARAVAAMAALAHADGVELRAEHPVRAVEGRRDGAAVVLDAAAPRFDRVVVAAGVWLPRLVPGVPIRVTRQSMAFFVPDDPATHRPGPMPVWAVDAPGDGWYGHPLPDGRVKVADNPLGPPAEPDGHRDAAAGFEERALGFVGRWMPGLAAGRLVESRSCLYENTPDGDFVVDWAPGSATVLVAGGGSGHGFKFGGAIGAVIADALEDRANALGDHFRIAKRFSA